MSEYAFVSSVAAAAINPVPLEVRPTLSADEERAVDMTVTIIMSMTPHIVWSPERPVEDNGFWARARRRFGLEWLME